MEEVLDHAIAFDWFQTTEEANVSFCFKGEFNQGLLHSVLSFWDRKNQPQETPTLKNKMFSLIVEAFQNITKHGFRENNGEINTQGIIAIGKKDNQYFLTTGNCMKGEESEKLKSHLDKLHTLTKDELKQLHKEILLTTELSDKSGANLGLVSIARKCENFNYRLRNISEDVIFFELEMFL